MSLRVTLIGCGSLGSALARRLSHTDGIELTVCDRHPERVEAAIGGTSAQAEPAPDKAIAFADVAVIAVKPPAVEALLRQLGTGIPDTCLVVSVAAGLPLARLQAAAPGRAVARTMPNTGASAGVSTTAYTLGDNCEKPRDDDRLRKVFEAVGEVLELRDESYMHQATALAGSGPAFLLLVLEAMTDAGIAGGLTRAEADQLARGALRAASTLADAQEAPPAELRARISSPGGTTIAGLGALEKGRARATFWDAVVVATARSRLMADE
jgi:pyrroline-5-carboxylate reductase